MNNQKDPPDSFLCPSFNSYSTDNLALIADQVAADHDAGESCDFEFVTFRKAADEVFFDGRVGPVFPVFDRDLLTDHETQTQPQGSKSDEEDAVALQFSMRELLIRDADDRDPPSSSSSSEVDDLESIPPGTYCVWTPKSAQASSPSRCEKSNSTGTSSSSSKKWKLLDLLRRSNSDGKESFVFLTPSASVKKREAKSENSREQFSSGGSRPSGKVAGKKKGNSGDGEKKVSAHEEFYVRNREMKKGERRKSYLPYRQDLVGFFANVHGMGKGKPFTSF